MGSRVWMQRNPDSREHGAAERRASRKVLTFALGAEVYGVDILRVKEIRGWSPVTRIPQASPSVLGVLNLRGVVVPIIDLRLKLGMAATEFTPLTVIIVLSLGSSLGQREVGIVVDSVKDVVDIDGGSIKPAPAMGDVAANDLVEGIVAREEMLILLDAECLGAGANSSTGHAEQAA